MRRSTLATIFLLSMITPSLALAQGKDSAIAEELFADGKRLLDQGDAEHACPKFAESLRLAPTLGTRLNLARCYEVAGKTASAWGEYKEVERRAETEGDTKRRQVAHDRLALIEAKLVRVTIRTPSAQGVSFRLDGDPLDAAVIGTSFPIDPGEHTLEATAPNKKPYSTTFRVDTSTPLSDVAVPALEDAASTQTAATTPAPTIEDKPAPSSGADTKRTAGFIVGGIGIASIGVGTFFGIRTLSLASDVSDKCPSGPCTSQDAVDENSTAHTDALLSDIFVGVGVVAIAAGAYLVLSAKSDASSHTSIAFVPSGSSHGAGGSILGRF